MPRFSIYSQFVGPSEESVLFSKSSLSASYTLITTLTHSILGYIFAIYPTGETDTHVPNKVHELGLLLADRHQGAMEA
jgi:hypothetical protein